MKIVILDRKTLGFDIDISIFEKFGEVTSYDVTKEDETLIRIKQADIIITNKVHNFKRTHGLFKYKTCLH